MNGWLVVALVLVADLALCLVAVVRGRRPVEKLVAVELGGVVQAVALLAVAVGYERTTELDLALVAALTSFVASIVFARFLERWT